MKILRAFLDEKRRHPGQSLVELAIILPIILIMLTGMVEFGNLLNQYINIVDGAREGARFASNNDPFGVEEDGSASMEPFFARIYEIVDGKYTAGVHVTRGAVSPIELMPGNNDDIVVTFFSVTTDAKTAHPSGVKSLRRFVSGGNVAHPMSHYNNHVSQFSNARVLALVDGNAYPTGIVLVEVFYRYHQILPLVRFSFNDTPGTIDLHAYSIMPLSAAEPTPTPLPSP